MKHSTRQLYNLLALVVALLLVACLAAVYFTQSTRTVPAPSTQPAQGAVDQRLFQTARQLDSIADTVDEQNLSREAARLADRELDQAFASALRDASAAPPPSSGPMKQLFDKIANINTRIADGQQRIAALTKAAATNDAAARQLDVAKAALALDEDELEDAKQELARKGGDRYGNVQRALQEHEAAQQHALPQAKLVSGEPATLGEQVQLWFQLRDREQRIQAALQQASTKSTRLKRVYDTLEKLVANKPVEIDSETSPDMLNRLRQLSDQRKTLAELNKRIQSSRDLTVVYSRWITLVQARRVQAVHLLLRSVALVLAIVLLTLLIDRGIRRAFGRVSDARRLYQVRTMATIAVQLAAAGLILLIVVGPPNQVSTILGLATAGLTIVMKDFIVAFFGWFALMGKNGVRIGDWVEIGGVSGEVIEIGVFKTVLLEMGNWTSAGHPTGRRVAMMNSFAIEGHYFNFSTSGQWLWDEMQVTLPTSVDPYRAAQQIRELVERETDADSTAAQKDWERVTQQYKTRVFSAKPAVEFRTSSKGLDVAIRYMTRAPQRFEVRARLQQAIVDVLQPAR